MHPTSTLTTPSQMGNISAWRRFRRLSVGGVAIVYLLILAGGIVRATGSGMGCPDWPKCFGQLIPPTDESQLPADYRIRYAGAHGNVEPFNAAKTWTEYLNRLLGALTGLVVLAVFAASLPLRKQDNWLPLAAGLVVVLTGVQAWLGKLVVERNLHGGTVTLHMLLAMLIVGLLIYVALRTREVPKAALRTIPLWLVAGVLALTIVQLALGTRVREAVDELARTTSSARTTWLATIGSTFEVHRSFSLLVTGASAVLISRLWSGRKSPFVRMTAYALGGSLLLALLGGLVLAYGELPTWAQPLHLLIGSLVVGAHLFAFLAVMQAHRT